MPRLFVSYARPDLPIVQALVAELRELGHEPFFDQNLTGGQRWWDVLLDRIQDSDGFLPVLSQDYRESEACRLEAQWAAQLGLSFLPIDLGQLGPELCDPFIAEANWVRYSLDDRGSVARLARGVNALQRPALPSPLPDRPRIPISYLAATEHEIRNSAGLSLERQLVIISTLRGKLGTNEDSSARTLLTELRRRPDITYANALDIDRLLEAPRESYAAARRPADPVRQSPPRSEPVAQAPPRPVAQQQPPPQLPRPPAHHSAQQPAHAHPPPSSGPAAPPGPATGIRPVTLVLGGLGLLFVVLALFALDWCSFSDGSQSESFTWSRLRTDLNRGVGAPGLTVVYLNWLGYLLIVLLVPFALIAAGWARTPRWWFGLMLGWAALTLLLTVLSAVLLANRAHQFHASTSYDAGFWATVAAIVVLALTPFTRRHATARRA